MEIQTVMAQIDDLSEQMPQESFAHLVDQAFTWPPASYEPAVVAAARMLDGLWLLYLGNWCPEDLATVTWKGMQIQASEAPLGYELLMAGTALRRQGCRLAARYASPAQVAALRTSLAHIPSTRTRALGEGILAWMDALYAHFHDEVDWYGRTLPAPIDVLASAFTASTPFHKQGNTSIVTPISLGRQVFFVKRLIDPGPLLALLPAFQNECAVTALLNALPWKLGPHTGCLYMGDDGDLAYLSNKVPGITMTDIRKAASRVTLLAVQAAVLAEFLGQIRDRHQENVFIDRTRAQPWLIDFAHALDGESTPLVLPDAHLPIWQQREDFTRALWTWHPDCLRTSEGATVILDEILQGILVSRPVIEAALRPFGLSTEAQVGVDQRFALLDRLAQSQEEKTLEHLTRLMQA